MKILLFLAILLLLLAVYICLSSVTILIHYAHNGDNDQLTIRFKALSGLFRKKINVPVIKVNVPDASIDTKAKTGKANKKRASFSLEWAKKKMEETKMIIRHVQDAQPIVARFLKKVNIRQLYWHSAVGVIDAPLTAKISGVAWSAKAVVLAVIHRFFRVACQPDYHVQPAFNRNITATEFNCIIQVKVGHAILTACKLLANYQRIKHSDKVSGKHAGNNETV
ncbi:DUF2953 domain-containing protein [Bacillus testis]|uniref:DUF2953 domain-containing protein n=1 Tax=Bacillus testis TaxID=1622072 RepID=UPI00067EAF41|nr:DUF2953 domain-containing protein [Bacillus testis]